MIYMMDVQGSVPIATVKIPYEVAEGLMAELRSKGFEWYKDYMCLDSVQIHKKDIVTFEIYNKDIIPIMKGYVTEQCI